MNPSLSDFAVVVVGAGPAGLFAARALAQQGIRVLLLNRDIKPGGLAEYGIYHDKHKIKAGLRQQFNKILEDPLVTYYGNVTVGADGDLTLPELQAMGFHALLVTVGAQGTKWLGLPGEELAGVYHAKDLIYYYNRLPPFSEHQYPIGKRVAIIGMGNTMADLARWATRDLHADEVVIVARRGPAEVKFDKKELSYVAANLDREALVAEVERVRARMEAVGQDPDAALAFILSAGDNAPARTSATRVTFRFLSSPRQILGNAAGATVGLEVDDTELVLRDDGDTKARSIGTTHTLDVDTVIFCIGDKVSDTFGLPVVWNSFVKHPAPRYPVEGIAYEVYDPEAAAPIEGVFVAGWSREASTGQVGLTRKDAQQCVTAMLQYLNTLAAAPPAAPALTALETHLQKLPTPVITYDDLTRLQAAEQREAAQRGQESFKYASNAAMLEAMGLK